MEPTVTTTPDGSTARSQIGIFGTADVTAQLRASARRFADLIGQVTDGAATSPHLPDWAAADIIRHVTVLPAYYREIASSDAGLVGHACEMAQKNDENIARVEALSISECADAVVEGIDAFCEMVENDTSGAAVPFQAGSAASLTELAAIAVGEYEVHGLDLAAAIGVPWTIPRDAAAMCVLSALPVAGAQWTDADACASHSGSYRIKLRGGSGAVRVEFVDGEATIVGTPDPAAAQRASTAISADPAALLRVFYRRQSQWSAIARGQMVSYGTRPLRALTLKDRFLPI